MKWAGKSGTKGGKYIYIYLTIHILLTQGVLLYLSSDAPLGNPEVFKEPSLENTGL